ALQEDTAAVGLDDLLGDGKTESGARSALVAYAVGMEERFEDALRFVGEEAFALVVDLEDEPSVFGSHPHEDLAAVRAELDGVVDQVSERLAEFPDVAAADLARLLRDRQVYPARLGLGPLVGDDRRD